MSNRSILVWGIVLVVVGLGGLGAAWALRPAAVPVGGESEFTSPGQRIYYTGRTADGRLIPRTGAGRGMRGMMGGIACVDCHGEDGRGGFLDMMFDPIEVPDIRYSALTSPHSGEEATLPGWSRSDIARAIREGIEPDGERLKPPMPRWDMTDDELDDVIDYLKELDGR